ncbi:hypothetical protein GYB22_11955 [bacterium]|nr:hypothetical protein [bacterium]
MDISEYIWIIGAVLYFLFSRGKRKEESPNAPKPKSKKQSRPRKSLEDILKELSGEGEFVPQPEPVVKKKPKARSRKKIEIHEHNEIYEDTINHDGDTGETIEILREKLESERIRRLQLEEYKRDFDLQQAVVYDAIMNKPYD